MPTRYPPLNGSGKVPGSMIQYGTTAGTACEGNDPRIGGGGAPGYQVIQEEGAPVTSRATVNFIGPRITAVDNPGASRTDVTVDAAALSHTHPESDITNLVADLAAKAALSHTHPESDITGLAADLATLDGYAGAFLLMGA